MQHRSIPIEWSKQRTRVVQGFGIFFIVLLSGYSGMAPSGGAGGELHVPEGLESRLWAESPMFYNPTSIDVDHRGRIWVAEAVNYRSFKNNAPGKLSHPEGDRVVILEDTDGDGKADKSTVFVQDKDLQSPVGIAVIGNKVIVSSAPSIVVYTDENGDDKPDKKEVFLTGFGGYDHDHSLHSVIAGPDGKWYFNTGNAGPHIVTDRAGWTLRSGSVYNGGSPYNKDNKPGLVSDDGRIWTGGLALRVDPDGKGLKVLAHNFRNAYEFAVDSYGNMWQNDNDDEVAACRTSWLMETGNAGFFSADGSRTWRADQRPGQDISTAHWHQEDPGVIPSGHITGPGAPTGVAFYEEDHLGKEYRGMVLSADAGRNVVFGFKPAPEGAGFELSRRINFASSLSESTENYRWDALDNDNRKWFRPSDVAVGTDGAVYVVDWYDPIVGGHAMHDTTGYGRIYRITPKNKQLKVPVLDLDKTEGQIRALLSPAVNVRNSGFTKLADQGDRALPDILRVLRKTANPYHRARILWLLPRLGSRGMAKAEEMLREKDPVLRLVAYRSLRSVSKDFLPYARMLADDPSPAVRREVALSLRDIPLSSCQDLLLSLADRFDGKDRWYLEALGAGMEGKESAIYPVLLERFGKDPEQWDRRMVSLVWRLHPAESAGALQKRALLDKLTVEERNESIVALAFIPGRQAAESMIDIRRQAQNPEVAAYADWWLAFRAGNNWAGFYEAKKQVEELSEEVKAWRQKITSANTPLPEQEAAAAALARDPAGAKQLFTLAAGKRLSPEITEVIAANIFSNPDQSVRVVAGEYFKRSQGERSFSIPAILKLQGNPVEGRQLFAANCASCHKMGALTGADIGPDLTGIRNKFDRRALLDAIVNPDADVMFGYEPLMITMRDGSIVYGFLQSEGAHLVVKEASGKLLTIAAKDVVSREKTRTLMPDPGTLGLEEQKLADIVAFLTRGD